MTPTSPDHNQYLSNHTGNIIVNSNQNNNMHVRHHSSVFRNISNTGISKERAMLLFNEALDFSNAERQEEKMREVRRKIQMIEEEKGGGTKQKKPSNKKKSQ